MGLMAGDGSMAVQRMIGAWLVVLGVACGQSLAEPGGADLKPIGQLTTDISPAGGKLPQNYAATAFSDVPIDTETVPTTWTGVCWEAPATCHRPLYYENINLERHGYSFGLAQPFVSAGHFVGSTFILPYRIAAEPPSQPVYTLGNQRPGNQVPFQLHSPPPCGIAGVAQAGVITGLIFLIP